jgi:hypothetical protein
VDRKLVRAFAHPDPDLGLRAARDLATSLDRTHPSAAASVREGLEEMFTVRRLGLSDALERTLTTTNPVESMISIARTTQRNAKNWKDASMARRWTAAGMLVAESNFRRLKATKTCRYSSLLLPDTPAQHKPKPSQPPPNMRTSRHSSSTTVGTSSTIDDEHSDRHSKTTPSPTASMREFSRGAKVPIHGE